jgi:hypothetical protein
MIVLAKTAGKKLALRAQTVFPAAAFAAAAWCPENLQCAIHEDKIPALLWGERQKKKKGRITNYGH